MYEFVGASFVVFVGVFAVFGAAESEFGFVGSFGLIELMDAIFGEESSVVTLDVGVSAGAVLSVVDSSALGGYSPISLH